MMINIGSFRDEDSRVIGRRNKSRRNYITTLIKIKPLVTINFGIK